MLLPISFLLSKQSPVRASLAPNKSKSRTSLTGTECIIIIFKYLLENHFFSNVAKTETKPRLSNLPSDTITGEIPLKQTLTCSKQHHCSISQLMLRWTDVGQTSAIVALADDWCQHTCCSHSHPVKHVSLRVRAVTLPHELNQLIGSKVSKGTSAVQSGPLKKNVTKESARAEELQELVLFFLKEINSNQTF